MKKIYQYLLLSFILLLSLNSISCSKSPKDTKTKDTASNTSSADSEKGSSTDENLADSTLDDETGIYTLTLEDLQNSYNISDTLYGIFLEDINYAVDGGLYAEKVKNASFEFGSLANDENFHGWKVINNATCQIIDGSIDLSYLNENNTHYIEVTNSSDTLAGIGNLGYFDDLYLEEYSTYNFSVYLKSKEYDSSPISIQIIDANNNIVSENTIPSITKDWLKYELQLNTTTIPDSQLSICILIESGTIDIDMVSLFPTDTYNNRENGLRKDLAQALEDLHPAFLRFPGGCVIEGETLDNAYNWKDSIGNGMAFEVNGEVTYGDVATRPINLCVWADENHASSNPYYMTYGIGFYEYFLLCEDLDCEGIPTLNAGLSCQVLGTKTVGTSAGILDINSDEFQQYIQNALDLVEFCKGDETTTWGAIRIAMGHTEPFQLHYIGIGNEQWGSDYFIRFQCFKEAFDQAAIDNPELYGDIELIVANGPNAGDTNAWDKLRVLGNDYADIVDEHYYMQPSWFLSNTNRYDSYDRESAFVFLGEYAAKSNTLEAALAEAAYMTGLERNGDIVKLSAYAPLFGNAISSQWSPDLIWYNTSSCWGSANYYVQKIFSNNNGTKVIPSTLTGTSTNSTDFSGKIGVGTWCTSAAFDNITVTSNETSEVLYSEDFSTDKFTDWSYIGGTWKIIDGQLQQLNTLSPTNSVSGDAVLTGDEAWNNYTLTLEATKLDGNEGFLIPILVKGKNDYYHWNIGGWSNTVSCLEQIKGGSKSGQISGTVQNVHINNNQTYQIKVVVSDASIECYLDEKLMVYYELPKTDAIYQVVSLDENNDIIIKLVNVTETPYDIQINLGDSLKLNSNANLSLITGDSLNNMNTSTTPDLIHIEESSIPVDTNFTYTAPQYSVSVIRIQQQ